MAAKPTILPERERERLNLTRITRAVLSVPMSIALVEFYLKSLEHSLEDIQEHFPEAQVCSLVDTVEVIKELGKGGAAPLWNFCRLPLTKLMR